MPLTRIRQTAIGNDSITTAKLDDTSGGLTLPGVEYVKVPVGTTAQRPSSPVNGYMRYNTNFERLEQYADGQWQSIDTPPSITSLSYPSPVTAADPAGGETITLTGSNFQAGATVTVGGTSATSVSVVSSTSITFTTPVKTAGDYDVVVVNSNGLSATLTNGISYNGTPSFTTAAGNVGSIAEDAAMSTITIVAAEPDGGTLAYSVTSGALPTGVSMSSAGAITGTPNVNPTSDTTFNFTVTATDDESQTNSRAFNLIVLRPIYATSIDNSLRLNDDDSAYLTRTPSSAGNRKTWTWSAWVKRGNFGSAQYVFFAYNGNSDAGFFRIEFNSTDTLRVRGWGTTYLETSALYRDTSAFYHIVLVTDTTQSQTSSTASDSRMRLYINGEQVTAFSSASMPSQNTDLPINNNIIHNLSSSTGYLSSSYFDGYLSDVHFIDGQALTPTSFAEEYYGVWVPKAYTGSYGTNGFRLPFEQSFTSGNSIDFGTNRTNAITYSDASSYDIGSSDDFTIEYFFKTSDVGVNYGNWMGHYNAGGPHHLIAYDFRSSTRDLFFYSNNGQALKWSVAGDVTLANGTWHHVVFQRDGTTLRAYIDGTRLTSVVNTSSSWSLSDGKATNFNQAYDLSQINIGVPLVPGLVGSLSNVRYVIGSTVYADDDNDITVPTSSLTAVANTKLLTAVNSTLGDDISSENNDGSVTGSPTVSNISPFGAQFYNDASSNGNNFIASGLVPTDVVIDSPTNNFATMNRLKHNNTSFAFSEGNLDVFSSQTGTNPALTGTIYVSSGKWYWETYIRAQGNASNVVGIASQPNDLEDDSYSGYGKDWMYGYMASGSKRNNNSAVSYGDTWTTGDIISVALDLDAGAVYFYKNGTIQNSGTAAYTSLSGLFVPYNLVYNNGAQVLNFGQDDSFAGNKTSGSSADADESGLGTFYYTVPSGYNALAVANLPESTIDVTTDDRPEDYFNTVIYSGDNTSGRSITGFGFQPDLVWIKSRTYADNHTLTDSIRGGTAQLRSNLNSSASQFGDMDISFNSDGFTNAGSAQNETGRDFVSWGWKAGGAPTATNSAGVGNVPTSGSVMIDGVASTSALAGTNPVKKLSANTKSGFSIVNYTGDAANTTKAHGLGKKPSFVICKKTDATGGWVTWHQDLPGTENDKYMYLDSVSGTTAGTTSNYWAGGFDVNVFGGWTSGGDNNNTGTDYIAYIWAEIEGFSKFGKYTGTANADGPYFYCGFKPSFVMMGNVSLNVTWYLIDNKIGNAEGNTVPGKFMGPGTSNTQDTPTGVDFLSNGFKIRTTGGGQNGDGQSHVFMAFAEDPFKYAEAK
jgi:hypothetical protein